MEGDCRDDEYLIEQERHRWLLPYLDLLRQGRTPENGDDQGFDDAQHGLAKTGLDSETARKVVTAFVSQDGEIGNAYARFYALLQNECSAEAAIRKLEARTKSPNRAPNCA